MHRASRYGNVKPLDVRRVRKKETFEILCYKIMLKIKWVDKITNEEASDKFREQRTL